MRALRWNCDASTAHRDKKGKNVIRKQCESDKADIKRFY